MKPAEWVAHWKQLYYDPVLDGPMVKEAQLPKMKKADDPFALLQAEANENGIMLTRDTRDGTFAGSVSGGAALEEYADARELLDDLLAIKEMDSSDSLYSYDSNEFEEAVVTVNGGEAYTAPSFAAAFALAKESVLEKARPAPVVQKANKAPSKRGQTTEIESEFLPTPAPLAEAEILPAVKPNGGSKGSSAMADTLSEACLEMAQTLTALAGKLRSSDALLPFRGSEFEEDEKPITGTRKVLPKTAGRGR
jgi:hypothetical protein